MGTWPVSHLRLFAPVGGEFAKHKTVTNIPSYARDLHCRVGRARYSLSKFRSPA